MRNLAFASKDFSSFLVEMTMGELNMVCNFGAFNHYSMLLDMIDLFKCHLKTLWGFLFLVLLTKQTSEVFVVQTSEVYVPPKLFA